MKKPIVSAIAAIGAKNRVLGKDNKLLWKIPEDMKRMVKITTGHPLFMGRKTFESFGGKGLPNRENIIITRDENYVPSDPKAHVVYSMEAAIELASKFDQEEIFNFGGEQIYKLGMPYVDRLYLTLVETDIKGDAYFPDYSEFTKEIERIESSDKNYKYTFLTLER